MRVLFSMFMLVAGAGFVVYSFIGSFIETVREMERAQSYDEATGPIGRLFEFAMNGAIPQLTNYLYLGALMIAVGVVFLIVGGKRKPDDE